MKEFNFYFKPQKLIDFNHSIEEDIIVIDAIPIGYIRKIFNQLNASTVQEGMNYQRTLKYSVIKEVLDYANRNYEHVKSDVFFLMLQSRYRNSMADLTYEIFQNFYGNFKFKDNCSAILSKAINKMDKKSLIELNKNYNNDKLLSFLIRKGKELKSNAIRLLELYEIDEYSVLGKSFLVEVISNEDRRYIDSVRMDKIIVLLQTLTFEEFIIFTNHYFKIYKWNDISYELVEKILELYGTEFDESTFWTRIDGKIVRNFRRYYIQDVIDTTLGDDDRSLFWKNHLDLLEDIKVNKVNEIIFLYFKGYVGIEFIKIGNAVYFYKEDVFNNNFKKYENLKYKVSESRFKEKSICIDKFNHTSNWQTKLSNWLYSRRRL